jgi:hypothetical protein
MKKPKLTKFKKTLNNTIIPATQTHDHGAVGKTVEEILKKQGLPIDSAAVGADVEAFDLEVKTRKKGSSAPVSIGSTSVDKIDKTDYQNSPIKGKLQTIRWVEYREDIFEDTSTSVVNDDFTLDFSDPKIQEELETRYNYGLDEISKNNNNYKIYDNIL